MAGPSDMPNFSSGESCRTCGRGTPGAGPITMDAHTISSVSRSGRWSLPGILAPYPPDQGRQGPASGTSSGDPRAGSGDAVTQGRDRHQRPLRIQSPSPRRSPGATDARMAHEGENERSIELVPLGPILLATFANLSDRASKSLGAGRSRPSARSGLYNLGDSESAICLKGRLAFRPLSGSQNCRPHGDPLLEDRPPRHPRSTPKTGQ